MSSRRERKVNAEFAKFKRKLWRSGAKEVAHRFATRTCDGCVSCCVAQSIEALQKPAGCACPYITNLERALPLQAPRPGCGIYSKRPKECVEFACGWRIGFVGDECNPRAGLVLDMRPNREADREVCWHFRWVPQIPMDRAPVVQAVFELSEQFPGMTMLFAPPLAQEGDRVPGGRDYQTAIYVAHAWVDQWTEYQAGVAERKVRT